MIYLASPYTHEYPEIMEMRYDFTMSATAYLIQEGYIVFSPIVHCHVMALRYNLPKDYKFWERYNKSIINSCSGFMLAIIEGWKQSTGVQDEYNFAAEEGKLISMIKPVLLNGYEITERLSVNPFLEGD